ncbi:hypothetical protein [Streptomyces sp. NPDC001137]|uniref:hypothetical protein n=1 Tax=Streptomyces sp. NPDC001137 TaxID=3154378 RepID=UPI003333B3B5
MGARAAWLALLPAMTGERQGQPSCPRCGHADLHARYIVDRETRIGYLLMWCSVCLHGISVSRVRANEGAEIRWFGDADALEGVPDFVRCE